MDVLDFTLNTGDSLFKLRLVGLRQMIVLLRHLEQGDCAGGHIIDLISQ